MKITAQQIFIVLATIAMITVNALANILPFNGLTTAAVSDSIHSFFVPAGYVFAIWGVIYLGLLVFAFGYSSVSEDKRNYLSEITPLYIFSCFLNAIWIVFWHFGFFLTTVTVMITLLVTLIMIYQILQKNAPANLKEKLIIHAPFSIYLAWICVATIANISGVLWLLHWNGFGIEGYLWAAIMMLVAGVLANIIAFMRKDIAFSVVVVWALVGIMVKFPEQTTMKYAGIAALFILAVSWISIFVISKRNGSTKK